MQPNSLNTKYTTIYIKNMVCDSCVKVVKWELERTGFIQVETVELGKAVIHFNEGVIGPEFINAVLQRNGFCLIDDKEDVLVEQIKSSVIQLIFFGNNTNSLVRNSDFLSQKLDIPYTTLSKIFSKKTTTTLEKFIIQIKIEKVKELISYNDMSLSEVAHTMGYSSVAYLSNQFKQITGMNVQDYKNQIHPARAPLNKVMEE